MHKRFLHLPLACLLTACGGGTSSNPSSVTEEVNPTPVNEGEITTIDSLHGHVIDGYIKSASLCVDLNLNQVCDSGEPTTQSANDGSFSFPRIQTTEDFVMVISSGGIDTVTNQTYEGTLKYITLTSAAFSDFSAPIYITPLRNLAATLFLTNNTTTLLTRGNYLSSASSKLSGFFQMDQNQSPMENKNYFLANQNIESIRKILLWSTKSEWNIPDNSSALSALEHNILYSIATQLYDSTDDALNIESILNHIESLQAATLSAELKQFISEQINSNQAFFTRAKGIEISSGQLESIQRSIESDIAPIYNLLNTTKDERTYVIQGMSHFQQHIDLEFLQDLQIPSKKDFDTPPLMPF